MVENQKFRFLLLKLKKKKRRGRKPKEKVKDDIIVVKKKRGRKKKCSSETLQDLFLNRNSEENIKKSHMSFETDNIKEIEDISNQQNILFGGLNITFQKKEEENLEEFKNILKNNNCHIKLEDENQEIVEDIEKKNYEESLNSFFISKDKYIMKQSELAKKKEFKISRVIQQFEDVNSKNTWPENTDIHCWWCCHSFENSPKTLPYKYDSITKRFRVMGYFCSWECVKAYNLDITDARVGQRNSYLSQMILQIYGSLLTIKSAPPRQALTKFGGYLSIEEFRDSTNDKLIKLINPPFLLINPHIEEVMINKVHKIENKNKKFRLQRNKNVNNDIINNLL